MSAAASTKIFGIRLNFDPKFLIAGLVVIAGLLYWVNSGGDNEVPTTPASRSAVNPPPPVTPNAPRRTSSAARRAANPGSERSVLAIRAVDGSRGDIDPTLRLDLLRRLRSVEQGKIGRSIFEIGSAPVAATMPPIKAPKIPVTPVVAPPVASTVPQQPQVNIPLKYYGYAKPEEKTELNRGLFLDGDNVLVAAEGQTVKGRYLVVELTPNSARLEDTQVKQGQTLPVMPQAQAQ
jgi:hypothetical protein